MRLTGSKKNLVSNNAPEVRKAMLEEDCGIPIKRQAYLLEVNRTSFYRKPVEKAVSFRTICFMHLIDEIYTKYPFYGYRRITAEMRSKGFLVNKKCVRRLMREMCIEAVYPGPNLSRRYYAQYCHPYLLRGLSIVRPNQVWGIDITYIRMGLGFMYLFVIIDWYSRKVVDYELSSTLEHEFVIKCLNRAIANYRPEIINSDQGSHFTNEKYVELLKANCIKISMDGKGRATDNCRTERFFRSLKYECIFLNEYKSPKELRSAINNYVKFYNNDRHHQCLGYQTPDSFYSTLSQSFASWFRFQRTIKNERNIA